MTTKLQQGTRYVADREDEYRPGTSTSGTDEEFCDYLDEEQAEIFQQIVDMIGEKGKWRRLFDKMQSSIRAREFDEAYTTFEVLSQELF